MSKSTDQLAERYITGEFEKLLPDEGSIRITQLENSKPEFEVLINMLRSSFRSAQGAALYVLYNREGPFPRELVDLLHGFSSNEDAELRSWAEACQDGEID